MDILGYMALLQSQQNMAIWVSNELSHSVEMAYRLEKNFVEYIFLQKREKPFFDYFLCIFAKIPLYLKCAGRGVDLSPRVTFLAFSHYARPTKLHSMGKILIAYTW